MDTDTLYGELARYLLLALTAPLWIPFVKAIWEELNRALRDEGGVFGRIPGTLEADQIKAEERARESPLLAEPLHTPGVRSETGPAVPGSVPVQAVRRHGFR